jgi:predicted ferric reductase
VRSLKHPAVWYLMRGSGVVTLVLLTLVVVLGIATARRWRAGRLPRFVTLGLHRNVSLLAVVFLGVHVGTALADSYASVSVAQMLVPMQSARYGLWLALGALSLDLVVAVVATSLLRVHLGQRAWKSIHWLAYASWPLALAHGLGMGTDRATGWLVDTAAACIVVVAAALGWRALGLRRPYPKHLEPAS